MFGKAEYRYSTGISDKEKSLLNLVLPKYDFDVLAVEKIRSAYKIYTNKGVFCLKRVGNGYRRAKKGYYVAQHLKANGFDNITDYYHTMDGKIFIRHKKSAFYMTYWIDGREVCSAFTDDIIKSAALLADFHNHAKGLKPDKHIKIKAHYKKWDKSFKRCIEEMRLFKQTIDKMKLKSEFDYAYRSHIDFFCAEANIAVEILEKSHYVSISDYMEREAYVCHDSFYYQNILMDKNGKLFIVDLESCILDIPISDLGKFIRRIMTKRKHKWDFDICRRIIESYTKVRPISQEEYTLLFAMLVFPHKFWKLGKKRYIKNKKWPEEKFKKKIRKLLRLREYKNEFLKCFVNFYHLDIDYDSQYVA